MTFHTRAGALYIVLAVLACAVLRCSAVEATPILLEPCEDKKTLVTRKASPVAGKPSPIIAWVTVRSGRPKSFDETCTDETVYFDIPEPEFILWEPLVSMPFTPEYEEPEEPWEPRIWWPRYVWSVPYPLVRIVHVPPVTTVPPVTDYPPTQPEPPTYVPPPHSVPEPGSLALLGLGLLGCATFTRKRSIR